MKKKIIVKLSFIAAVLMLFAGIKAHAVDNVIYTDGNIPAFGATQIAPNGEWMAYFSFAQDNATYIDSRTTPPLSPQGSRYLFATVGAGKTFGGMGTAFVVSDVDSTHAPKDLSSYSGGQLKFFLKSDRNLAVEIQYDNGSGGLLISNAVTVGSTGGAWQEITLNLNSANFGPSVDYAKIRVPFLIKIPVTYGTETQILVDHIRWVQPTATNIQIYPPETNVNPGKRRMFTIEGVVNPNLSLLPASLGTLSTSAGNVVIFTASPTIQAGNLQAEKSGDTKVSTITVTNQNLAQVFGVHSETVAGVIFDTNASFSPYGTGTINVTTTTAEKREGEFSVKTDVNVGAGQFSGWAVEWSPASPLDMNEYFDGSIRFWFRGPAALANILEVGIRSNNVTAGAETSKVFLKEYTTFDNTWRPVAIPVEDFAGAAPQADIARTRVLVNFVIGSPTGGLQSFYVDNVRWDTLTPGNLTTLSVTPANVTLPLNLKRSFVAKGFDAAGVEVDIFPTWSTTGGSIGTLSNSSGTSTRLTAADSPASGNVQATFLGVSSAAAVTVTNVVFTQSYNVYSDAGSGGFVGVSQGGGGATQLALSEQTGPQFQPPEGNSIRRSTYTLADTSPGANNAFALWFTEHPNGSRFMRAYEQGYLHFWVKTGRNLQISIRSDNIPAGTEKSKFTLSELGVPTNNTWQEVWLSLADFKNKEPNLDFDQIKVFFAIAALSSDIGEVTNEVFDVDDVKWFTADPTVPDVDKVYEGLKEKQRPSGLVRSFETLTMAVTYDQALAALCYTYRKDTASSKSVLDVFKEKFDAEAPFLGFRDVYHVDTKAVLVSSRSVGPNAFVLLAAMHYKAVTGSTLYDAMIDGIATWIKDRQDADGAVKFGFTAGGTERTEKSTEHNFDTYAAFKAYIDLKGGDAAFETAMDNIRQWLDTEAYDSGEGRFNVGELGNGTADTRKALDAYSLAPLALSSYTAVLDNVDADFRVTKQNDLTGANVDGYDFGGPGATPDKDAVWLEGTAQMAVAFLWRGSTVSANFFINEIEKAIVSISATGQGITYATNEGTAFGGFTMDSLNPAISSMAWYIFAKSGFNPFRPLPRVGAQIRNISNNNTATEITWTANVPAGWIRANQYIEIETQQVSTDNWGIQIYTFNEDPLQDPRFGDPTPAVSSNIDSNPAGLILDLPGNTTTSFRLDMAWSAKDTLAPIPVAESPISGAPNSFQWIIIKDSATPAIDLDGDGATGGPNDLPKFQAGADDIVVKKASGLHGSQGNNFFPSFGSSDYIFFQADFTPAAAQVTYKTFLILEFFNE